MHAAYAFVLKATTEYMQTPVTQFDARDCLKGESKPWKLPN